MADISIVARLVNGVLRNVDLASNTLVVNEIKVGGGAGTTLTQAILNNLVSLQNGSDISASLHHHDGRYYTETELDGGQLDNRYYTETELDGGQLDNRYFTETELGGTASDASGAHLIGTDSAYSWANISPGTHNVQTVLEALDAQLTVATGATAALDNLASVAINTSLISDTDVTDDLGSSSIKWNNSYVLTQHTTDIKLYDNADYTTPIGQLIADESGTALPGNQLAQIMLRATETGKKVGIATAQGGAAATMASASDIDSSTDTFTKTSHGYSTGMVGQFVTDDTLPSGISASTNYYVIVVDANSFKVASSEANAYAGTPVDFTDNGTGNQTFVSTSADIRIETGSGGTTAGSTGNVVLRTGVATGGATRGSVGVFADKFVVGANSFTNGVAIDGSNADVFNLPTIGAQEAGKSLVIYTADSGSSVTGDIYLSTGTASNGNNSGSIVISTYPATGGGTQGEIKLIKNGDTTTAGHIWTATSTDGSGYWSAPSFDDSLFKVTDSGDGFGVVFDVSAATADRTITFPDADVNIGALATTAYVDAVAAGVKVKDPVDLVATSNITLSGEQTIDGVLTSSSRVLVIGQSSAVNNGIYVTSSGAWTRATDFDGAPTSEVPRGSLVLVLGGTSNTNTHYVLSGTNAADPTQIDIGTETNTWTIYSRAEAITASTGLTKSGLDIQLADASAQNGITVSSGAISISLATDPGLEFSASLLRTKVDATGGANLASVVDRNANGLAIRVDDTTIEDDGNGATARLRVKAGGIGENELNNVDGGVDAQSFVLPTGYTAGAGTVAAGDTIDAALRKLDGNNAATQSDLDAVEDNGIASSDSSIATSGTIGADNLDVTVNFSPRVQNAEVAGEAMGTGLKAVRYGIDTLDAPETAGRVYLADPTELTLVKTGGNQDPFHVVGLCIAASETAGTSINVVKSGLITATSHGLTVGQPCWLDSSGAVTSTAPSTSGEAIVKVGVPKDANTIDVQIQIMGVN